MTQIAIEGMEFYAYHGCFKEEQIVGTHFCVDLVMDFDTTEAENSDDLSKTIDYQSVYAIVKAEFDKKSKLIEHVAGRIAVAVKSRYPLIGKIKIKVAKLNPPVGGKVHSVSITKIV
jgi:7,8-dihydroneopterin aldolase/epimerase/oxygenase